MKNLHCPGCGTSFVRMTCQERAVERLLHCLHIVSFRCQLCTAKFHAYWSGSFDRSKPIDSREYTRLPSSFQAYLVDSQDIRLDGRVTEISMGGCTFETPTMLPCGSLLELTIKPASDDDPITIETATVCSVRQESLGVRFLDLQPHDKHRLSQVVLNLFVGQGIRSNPQL